MKTKSAIFLTFLFLSLLTVPSILKLAEYDVEISSTLDLSEEEENKNEELEKEVELIYTYLEENNQNNFYFLSRKNQIVKHKNYRIYFFSKKTPPPELIF